MSRDPAVARTVIALVGPTAVGKSAVAIELARMLGAAEIVNCDALQLYRGMDIGTGKVPVGDRAGVAHHLLDIWPVGHRASVVEFQELARRTLTQVADRAAPIMVGGSGLYLTAALDDLQVPATDPQLRAALQERLAAQGPIALHQELAGRDPVAAAAIDPANGRRVVRALEVVELTGSFTASLPRDPTPWAPARRIGLISPMPALDEAIAARVAGMWEQGLMGEVAQLEALGLRLGPTAGKAIGYAEALAHLDGRLTRDEAVAATAQRTRQLARRQLRWFRRDGRVEWLVIDAGASPRRTAARVAALLAGNRVR